MNWTALLLGGLGDDGQPLLGIGVGVRIGDAQRAVVDFLLLQVFEASGLVGRLEFRKVDAQVSCRANFCLDKIVAKLRRKCARIRKNW